MSSIQFNSIQFNYDQFVRLKIMNTTKSIHVTMTRGERSPRYDGTGILTISTWRNVSSAQLSNTIGMQIQYNQPPQSYQQHKAHKAFIYCSWEILEILEARYQVKNFRNVANNFIHGWKIGKKNHDSKCFCARKTVISWIFMLIKKGGMHILKTKIRNFRIFYLWIRKFRIRNFRILVFRIRNFRIRQIFFDSFVLKKKSKSIINFPQPLNVIK